MAAIFQHTTIVIIVVCITIMPTKTQGSSDSCPISIHTVNVVNSCPENEVDWQEAATRKNCSQHASQCDEPDRLQYHCVINPIITGLLEVCAYVQNIVGGHCTDYSTSGNLIKWNTKTDCTTFLKPCPVFYLSIEGYKYPGCYNLTKKTTTANVESTMNGLSTSSFVSTTNVM
uniref:Uncharacterized protein LOC111102201 n=1 Tax=Crassostrea virginica TaxID=6565 RepID=A0A8B8AHA8_CRAVI|nr:uncharacterized protein LOC111102201 [Crassostrea virginica]